VYIYSNINKKVLVEGQCLNKVEHIREADGALWVSTAGSFHHLLPVTSFFDF